MSGLVEVERVADIAVDSFRARNFGGRYSRRDWVETGNAQNAARSRE
jgi:hypothetical protein